MATTIIKCAPESGIVRIVRHTMGKQDQQQEWRDEELRRLHAEEHVPANVLADHYGLPLGYLVNILAAEPAAEPKRKRKPDVRVIDATKPKRQRGKRVKLVGPKRPQGRPRKAA